MARDGVAYADPAHASLECCYDGADRLTSSVVLGAVAGASSVSDGLWVAELGYDVQGNTSRLADMSLGYDANDAHASMSDADGSSVRVVHDASVAAEVLLGLRSVRREDGLDELRGGDDSSALILRRGGGSGRRFR